MNENQRQEIAARLTDLAMVEIDSLAKQLEDARAELAMYRDAELAWERNMMAAIGEDGIKSVSDAIGKLKAEVKELRAAILATEPARDDGKAEVGDWVAVRFTGGLSSRGWTAMVWDEECKEPGWFEEVRVIERAAEVKRRIEATHG